MRSAESEAGNADIGGAETEIVKIESGEAESADVGGANVRGMAVAEGEGPADDTQDAELGEHSSDNDSGYEDKLECPEEEGQQSGFQILQLGHDLDDYRFNRFGFDRQGYDADGFDANGWDRDGLDRGGFNIESFDRDGYDYDGYDRNDLDRGGNRRPSWDDDDDDFDQDYDNNEPAFRVQINLFAIIGMVRDEVGTVIDLHLQRLEYNDSVPRATAKAYRLFPGTFEMHNEAVAFGFDIDSETLTTIIGNASDFDATLSLDPDEDGVRRVLQDYGYWTHHCNEGFCHSLHDVQDLVTETLPQLTHFEPICPVCTGKDLLDEHLALRRKVDDSTLLDLTEVFNWLSKINSVREQQGLPFVDLDDRQWGFSFDEDSFGGGNFTRDADGSVWQAAPAEALDAAAVNIVTDRPAAAEAVEALQRPSFDELSLAAEDRGCIICCEEMEEGEVLAQMPCSHTFHDKCLKSWLSAQNTCPSCRYALSVAENGEMEGHGDRAGEHTENIDAAEGTPPRSEEIRPEEGERRQTTWAEDAALAAGGTWSFDEAAEANW